MDKNTTKKALVAATAILIGGCATVYEMTQWNPPAPGSTWTMSQQNTGSYGKDADVVLMRTDTVWQEQPVVAVTNVASGGSILIRDLKWLAIADKDRKPMMTYDPPIGYVLPLKVGREWNTHHRMTNHAAGRTIEFDYKCKVESYEDVTVKAGTFGAFKIACENELSREVSWYSPRVGVNIKQDLMRKPANPSGPGTQRAELAMLNLK